MTDHPIMSFEDRARRYGEISSAWDALADRADAEDKCLDMLEVFDNVDREEWAGGEPTDYEVCAVTFVRSLEPWERKALLEMYEYCPIHRQDIEICADDEEADCDYGSAGREH
jgi:hypothetical protein